MALLGLALLVVVIFSFIAAALSSRARSEKRSIASFHQHMGQLSGVVKSEGHAENPDPQPNEDLFGSVRSHVKVVGKSGSGRASGGSKRRSYRSGQGSSASSRRGRGSPDSTSASSEAEALSKGRSSASEDQLSASVETSSSQQPFEGGSSSQRRRNGTGSRRTRLSASARAKGAKSRSEILQFTDDVAGVPAEVLGGGLPSLDRRVNTKLLAAASVVALAGLGTIFIALNGSHGASSSLKGPAPSSSHHVTPPESTTPTTPTTVAPPSKPAGPLTPASANSAGATYFIDSPSITVDVSASAPSWIEESVTPGSKVLWQGILPKGGSKSFTLNSSMWIRTGNVGVLTMTVNGKPISFSAPPGVFNFTFRQGVKA